MVRSKKRIKEIIEGKKKKPKNPFGIGGFVPVGGDHKLAKKIVKKEVMSMSDFERKLTLHKLRHPTKLTDGTTLGLNDKGRMTLHELEKQLRKNK